MPSAESLSVLRLPECGRRREGHVLSARQRREIVRILATKGKTGLEKWLREEEKRDPYIRRRVEEERERLERQARQEERGIKERYGKERSGRTQAWQDRMQAHAAEEEMLRGRIEKARRGPQLDLELLANESELFRAAAGGEKRSFGRWLLDSLYAVWLWFVRLWVRFIRFITGRARKEEAQGRVVTLNGVPVELKGLTSINPRLVAQVRKRMRTGKGMRERMKQAWDRLLGREDYAEVAQRLMQEELRSRYQKTQLELDAEAAELEKRLKDLERIGRQEARRQKEELDQLGKEEEKDLEALQRKLRQGPYESARDEILDELADAGLVDAAGDPKEALLERFSMLLYDEARRTLPAGGTTTPGTYLGGEGEYHKAPLQSLNERGAMELVDSVVRARLYHPHVRHLYDADLVVHREVRTAKTHVVLIFDQSGSMEEKDRLDAAKTVCLVIYRAVKEADPMNRVDILAMSTGVEQVDLAGLWNAEPKGFTNHGAALREARYLLEDEGADRRLVYLITDGLPEAMTVRGVDTADRPEVCMPYALEEARTLATVEGTRLFVIQLETTEPMYVEAAKKIADAAGGVVEAVEPEALTRTLLSDFEAVQTTPREAA